MQKRLLLINLKELNIEFVKATDDKIGFSKFSSLHPKWCVPVTWAGMHSVCVCELHQNAKLLLTVIPSQIEHKNLLEKIVCSTHKAVIACCTDVVIVQVQITCINSYWIFFLRRNVI